MARSPSARPIPYVENMHVFGESPVVALNCFASDTPEEAAAVRAWCEGSGVPFAESDVFAKGGEGGIELSGAGDVVPLLGDSMRMPGLPASPQAERLDLVDGVVVQTPGGPASASYPPV